MKPQNLIRRLSLFLALALTLSMVGFVAAQDDDGTYTDPAGMFSVPIPTNWRAEQIDDYVLLASPDDEIKLFIAAIDEADPQTAIESFFDIALPDFDQDGGNATPIPAAMLGDLEDGLAINYVPRDGILYQGVAQVYDGVSYVFLVEGSLTAIQQRAAQINIINTGFSITALEEDDDTVLEARPLTDDMIAEVEAFVPEALAQLNVPGAVVAIVQGDEIVYVGGFGVRERDGDPVDAETLMMIGSTTKSMTTMAMGALVDDGLLDWDAPAIDYLPSFAVADPELTESITIANLVCACSGVPRRDFEIIFNATELSAEDIIESLGTYEFFTDFGEAFQYSNQMVAAGGYAAAAAVAGEGDLYAAYIDLLQERILDPIGMTASTIDFDAVRAYGNYAIPYGGNLELEYVPIPLSYEEFVTPVAPAGALWASGEDMARYLLTAMNLGVAPDGTRIISEENLLRTWEPQVPLAANVDYGLGWFVETYRGMTLISHGGNMLGFTSELMFLPDAGIGVAVITNAQGTNSINQAIAERVFELVFDLPAEAENSLHANMEQVRNMYAELEFTDDIDADFVAQFLGDYTNEALGNLTLEWVDDALFVDTGEFRAELRGVPDKDDEFITFSPPLASVPVFLRDGDDGRVIVVGSGVVEYTFTPAE